MVIATILSARAAYAPTPKIESNNLAILNTSTINSADNFDKTLSTPISTDIDNTNTATPVATPTQTDGPASSTAYTIASNTAQMTVGDRIYTLRFANGEKLIDAMEKLSLMSSQPFLVATKEYTGMGKFVEEINGIKNNPTTNEYWGYYVNGESAQVGASNYILKQGDKIEWKYAKITF